MDPGGLYPKGMPVSEPWTDLPFDYDPERIAADVEVWANDCPRPGSGDDPANKDGVLAIRIRSFHSFSLADGPKSKALADADPPVLVLQPCLLAG